MLPLQTWQAGMGKRAWEMSLPWNRTHFVFFQKCLTHLYTEFFLFMTYFLNVWIDGKEWTSPVFRSPMGWIKKNQSREKEWICCFLQLSPGHPAEQGHVAYMLKTLCWSAAVSHRDDGRNRLRALPCEESSWKQKPRRELVTGVMMDTVIEGTCVAYAIDRTGEMQQKKQTLLKKVYSSSNHFTFLQQCFKREEYLNKITVA